MDPVEHYLWIGAKLGRDPSPTFSSRGYSAAYPDVADSGFNPLLHYIYWGKAEGRIPISIQSVARQSEGSVHRDLGPILQRIEAQPNAPVIIVPIYNAVEETELCIESVLRNTPKAARIILIDDKSPDPRMQPLLAQYVDRANIEILHNERNLDSQKRSIAASITPKIPTWFF